LRGREKRDGTVVGGEVGESCGRGWDTHAFPGKLTWMKEQWDCLCLASRRQLGWARAIGTLLHRKAGYEGAATPAGRRATADATPRGV
jgi:hypothetical protein